MTAGSWQQTDLLGALGLLESPTQGDEAGACQACEHDASDAARELEGARGIPDLEDVPRDDVHQASPDAESHASWERWPEPVDLLGVGAVADISGAAAVVEAEPEPTASVFEVALDASPFLACPPDPPSPAASADEDLRVGAPDAPRHLDRLAVFPEPEHTQGQPSAVLHGAAPMPCAPVHAAVGSDVGFEPLPNPPETLLILDTETTALRPEEGQCIEVGAVLFHVPQRAVLTQVSFLLPCDHNPAEVVNGIPAEVTRLRQPWPSALACFEAMAVQADAVLAHNASFDRQWFGQGHLPLLDKPWICSMEDMRWPASLGLRSTPSVVSLALAYGVPVWAAHRALTDCTYLVQVFQRCVDLEQRLAAALEPRSLMRAEVSYADRHLAREAGFRWDQPVAKAWTRRLSRREARSLPFAVHPVEVGVLAARAC